MKNPDKKNLVLFSCWTQEEFDMLNNFFREHRLNVEKKDVIQRKVILMEKFFEMLKFEYVEDRIVLADCFKDTTAAIRFARIANESFTRGWIFDLKELFYIRVFEEEFVEMAKILKSFTDFDELENFTENFKHRFASKKFGL